MRLLKKYIGMSFLLVALGASAQDNIPAKVVLATPFTLQLPANDTLQKGSQRGPFAILDVAKTTEYTRVTVAAYDTGRHALDQYFTNLTGAPATLWVVAPPADSIKNYRQAMEVLPLLPATEVPADGFNWKHLFWLLPLLLLLAWWLWKKQRKEEALPPVPPPTQSASALLAELMRRWQAGEIGAEGLGTGFMQVLYLITGTPVPLTTRGLRQLLRQQQPHLDTSAVNGLLRHVDAWRFGKQPAREADANAHCQLLEGMIFFTQKRPHA